MPRTLLLADDSVTIQRVIELTFAHEDVRVVSVGDGRRALQWLESEVPDIVLADVNVPEVDGYAIAAHLKQTARLRNVPVLLLAGAFEPVDQGRVRQIGCEGVLIKPFEPQQLVGRVREILSRPAVVPSERGGDRAHTEPGNVRQFPTAAGAKDLESGPHRVAAQTADPAEPLELPERVWDLGGPDGAQAAAGRPADLPPAAPPPTAQKVSLVSAFSALLAAEQSTGTGVRRQADAISEATVEDAVRRVLVKMTDELVRRIVVETAERLIREEIEKIKSAPE